MLSRFALLLIALAHAPLAAADDAPRQRHATELDAELAEIDARAAEARALYLGGTITHVIGLAAAGVFGLASTAPVGDTLCEMSLATERCHGDDTTSDILLGLAVASMVVSAAGLATIFAGVGVDIDSGRRRSAWRERARTRVSIAPMRGGALASFGLDF